MTDSTRPFHLTCEHLTDPIGLDTPAPRLSWWLPTQPTGLTQSAYRLRVATSAEALGGDPDVWDSGKVETDTSVLVPYAGPALKPFTAYAWSVTVFDDQGRAMPESEPATFETGFMGARWDAQWIGSTIVGGPRTSPPAPLLRRSFSLPSEPVRARLYATALGVYDCAINGSPAHDDVLSPGWTDFRQRVYYRAYDVTDQLRKGDNAIGVTLGDGWYAGHIGGKVRQMYGDRPRFRAQLHVTCADGSEHTIHTNPKWRTTTGHVVEADIIQGQAIDHRLEPLGWTLWSYDDHDWAQASAFEHPAGLAIQAPPHPPIRPTQVIDPIDKRKGGRDWWGQQRYILDFGQNLVGVVELRGKLPAGGTVRVRHGEMLNADGSVYFENLRSARCTDYFTFRGDDDGEAFRPTLTFHGFRYAELTYEHAWSRDDEHANHGFDLLDKVTAKAVVYHTDLPRIGAFECDDAMVNQLQSNIVWGQRGNFVDVPTDCPQRDERLGWTGDAQVFAETALFNYDCSTFFEKYRVDMVDAQCDAGQVANTAPDIFNEGHDAGPGWSDAFALVPWMTMLHTGDLDPLRAHHGPLRRWIDFLDSTSRNGERCWDDCGYWQGFGDWLAIDAPDAQPLNSPTPKPLIGTAYFAHSARLTADILRRLAKPDDADRLDVIAAKARAAFQRLFVKPGGRIEPETQTGYGIALRFDLLDPADRPAAGRRFADLVTDNGHKLNTGFLGTPTLCPALSQTGHLDEAYRLLHQPDCPGWLFPVGNGATTMWERWNSWTPPKDDGTGGFGEVAMNSFNHYAYGAVGQWLYQSVAGLAPDPSAPGYKRLRLNPTPPPTRDCSPIRHARATLETPFGAAASGWMIREEDDAAELHYACVVPPNTTATLTLPGHDPEPLNPGPHERRVPWFG